MYGIDPEEPLFYRTTLFPEKNARPNKKGAEEGILVPTLWALWKCPHIIPPIYIQRGIVDKVTGVNATSLYTPGIWVPELPDAFFSRNNVSCAAQWFDVTNTLTQSLQTAQTTTTDSDDEDTATSTSASSAASNSAPSPSMTPFPTYFHNNSFDFAFTPRQLRAIHVLGNPYPVAVAILPPNAPSLPSRLEAAKIAANNKEYTTAWCDTPWPQTWPPSAVQDSDKVDFSEVLPDVMGPYAEMIKATVKYSNSGADTGNATTKPEILTYLPHPDMKSKFPGFTPFSLSDFANTPWESRPFGRGVCAWVVHSINDSLFSDGNPAKVPADGFSWEGRKCVAVSHPDCATKWRDMLTALRCTWLAVVATLEDGAEAPNGGDAQAQEQENEVGEKEDSGKDISPENDVEENPEESASDMDEDELPLLSTAADEVTQDAQDHVEEAEGKEEQITEDVLTRRLDWAIMYVIKKQLKSSNLPINDSEFMNKYLRLCLACPTMLALCGGSAAPAALVLKSTKYKKLSTFLKSAQKQGWLTVKNVQGGEGLLITSINPSHPDIVALKCDNKDDRVFKEMQDKASRGEPLIGEAREREQPQEVSGEISRIKLIKMVRATPALHAFLTSIQEQEQDAKPADNADANARIIDAAATDYQEWCASQRVYDLGAVVGAVNAYIKQKNLVVIWKPSGNDRPSFANDDSDEDDYFTRKPAKYDSNSKTAKSGASWASKVGDAPVAAKQSARDDYADFDDLDDGPWRKKNQEDYDDLDDYDPRNLVSSGKQQTSAAAAKKPAGKIPDSGKNKGGKSDAKASGKQSNAPCVHLQADAPLSQALALSRYQAPSSSSCNVPQNPYRELPLMSEVQTLIGRCVEQVYCAATPLVAAVGAYATASAKRKSEKRDIPTKLQNSGAQESVFASNDALLSTLYTLRGRQSFHSALRSLKWSAGTVPAIDVSICLVKGKTITIVAGLERFGMSPEGVVDRGELKQWLACAATVVGVDEDGMRTLAGVALEPKVKQLIYIQGDQEVRVSSYMEQKAGIDKECIHVHRRGKTKK